MRNIRINCVLTIAVVMSPWPLLGEADTAKTSTATEVAASEEPENLLDDLEKKMTDNDSIKIGPSDPKHESEIKALEAPKKADDLPQKTLDDKHKPAAQRTTLKEIQSKISEYENRIEILESDLRRLRANVYDASVTDNLVAIEIQPSETSKFLLRDVRAQLNGNTLYDRNDPSGLWMPNKSIMLFHGPLRPGDHQINISAILVPLAADGMKLATFEHRSLDQSFRFTIPEGKHRRRIVVEIAGSDDENSKPIARLIEGETK